MLLKIMKAPVLDYTTFTNKYVRLYNTYWHILLPLFWHTCRAKCLSSSSWKVLLV